MVSATIIPGQPRSSTTNDAGSANSLICLDIWAHARCRELARGGLGYIGINQI